MAFENFTVQRVPVLLAQLGWLLLTLVRHLSCLDVGPFGIAVALLRRRHDRGIDDLAAHRQIARLAEVLVEPGKQALRRPSLRKVFPKHQIVLASGTLSPSPCPRNRMKENRSWI
ncbi:hypothetical protein ASD99_21785 [Mesorhizobium sp. Root695]|nr:hypothetical protein ASD99_21785 [Mesorhizobium sp. Root695]